MPALHHGNRTLELVIGKSIFDYADDLHVRVPTSCGRSGECHECIVEVKRGLNMMSSPGESEVFLRGNYRLACQSFVADSSEDVEFDVLRRQPRILTHSVRREIDLAPKTVRVDDDVYQDGIFLDSYRGRIHGLAIDVGTTTVVMNLVDLETGEVLQTSSFENPQRFGGSDVMNRISYDAGEFSGELHQVILSSINFEIGDMCRRINSHRRQIYEVVIVANATMRDIVFGLNVQSIGEKPYKSITELQMDEGIRSTTALNMEASDLGIRVFPKANVYGGPLVGCHIGSDIAAGLLAVGMYESQDTVMMVDVGTNTEVVVGNSNKMMAASCPAGPAFEGGDITYGMPGYDGAVESVAIDDYSVSIKTIGGTDPVGICGSGLVDLLSELRRTGQMNELGVFKDGAREIFFDSENRMSVSRSDVSALAQAKSANYCGQKIVLRSYGVTPRDIDRLYLAGGFANYVDVENAKNIGFIANVPKNRVTKVGNAALEGGTIMLISAAQRMLAENMVTEIEHVELETTPDFFEIFVDGCHFNPMENDTSL